MAVRRFRTMPPGTRIAERYMIVRYLGSGGMGDVYEVEHTLLGRRFALKRLAAEKVGKPKHVERFLREARVAAATGHVGVVEVVDLGFAEDGWPFLVMEHLRGETLRERLRGGPLDPAEVLQIGGMALDALDAVHRCGVVHRDIKPENLFLCDGGDGALRLKILDFGLAELHGPDDGERSHGVVGTPHYMAPEQVRGDDVDHRCDLHAVGAVLYECAVGHPPFAGTTYSALVAQIVQHEPLPDGLDVLPASARSAILRALAKRPEQRWSDAALMRHVLCGEPTGERPAVPADEAAPVELFSSSRSWPTEVPTLDDAPADDTPMPGRGDPTDRVSRPSRPSRLPPARHPWRALALVAGGAVAGAAASALLHAF
jgi:eukaryotic-like serine/threonine-protein kinase